MRPTERGASRCHNGIGLPSNTIGSPSHTKWWIPSFPERFTVYIAASATRSASRLVSIGVSNVERSLEYYQRVFGYSVRTSQSRGARPVLTIGRGPQFVMLREGSPDGHHFCLGIDPFDPDDVMATLAEHGVRGQ